MKAGTLFILAVTIAAFGCKPESGSSDVESLENFVAKDGEAHHSLLTCTPNSELPAAELKELRDGQLLQVSDTLAPEAANLLADVDHVLTVFASSGYQIVISNEEAAKCSSLKAPFGRDLTLADGQHKACYRSVYTRAGSDKILSKDDMKNVDADETLTERLQVVVAANKDTMREQLLRGVGYALFGRIIDMDANTTDDSVKLSAPDASLWQDMLALTEAVLKTQHGQRGAFAAYQDMIPANYHDWSMDNFRDEYSQWVTGDEALVAAQLVRHIAAEGFQNFYQCEKTKESLRENFSDTTFNSMVAIDKDLRSLKPREGGEVAEGQGFGLWFGRRIANRVRARRANRRAGIYGIRNWVAPQVVARNHGVSYAHRGLDWNWRNGANMGWRGQGFGGYYTRNHYGNYGNSGTRHVRWGLQ